MEAFVYDELQKREAKDWWFVGRRNIILALLTKYFPRKKNLSIIDIGCGAGDVIELLKPFGKVIGIDSDKGIVEFNRRKGRDVYWGKIYKLGLPKESINLVALLEVLEHLGDDRKALREIFQILKTQGLLIITVPAFSFLWGSHDIAAHHKRRYTEKELERKLRDSGFQVIKISYMNTFLFPPIFFIRIFKNLLHIGQGRSDFFECPSFLNVLLEKIFSLEARLLSKINLPFGISVIALAKKP